MPIPDFIVELRTRIGTAPLWLSGSTVVTLREGPDATPEVLLVKRADTGEWALVSGIVDPGEHPVDTIVREAMEETGVVIAVERMLWLLVGDPLVYPNGDQCQFLEHGFVARYVSGEAIVGDEESTQVGWFPITSLPYPRQEKLASRVGFALDGQTEVRFAL